MTINGKKYLLYIIVTLFCGIIMSSCNVNKHISKNGYLLGKNKIEINNKTISKGEINNYIVQDPNDKFLFFKAGMYIYSISRPGEDSLCNFFERYLLRTIGDKPVEIDEQMTELSCKNIKTYLKTNGCFDATIRTEQSMIRKPYAPWKYYKKRHNITYIIDAQKRYKVDTVMLKVEDLALDTTIYKLFINNNTIKHGDWYDENKLTELRNNVASAMLNEGYYTFNQKYISFEVDTTFVEDKARITMIVSNPQTDNNADSSFSYKHKPYKITKIFLQPNYISSTSADYLPVTDTVLYYHKQQKGYAVTPLYFLNNTSEPYIKEKTLMRCILMQNNNLFSPQASQNTYHALSQLKNFKYIDISYEDLPSNSNTDTNSLVCYIRLTRAKPISLSSSFELNYSASNGAIGEKSTSNFGMEGNFAYTDKNLFKGAEIFTANLKLAAEVNSKIFTKESTLKGWDLFNAFETGVSFGIELPRFLSPYSTSFYSMKFHPHTSIQTGYNFQKRSYYERVIFNFNYGYSWNTTQTDYFSLIPLDVNYVKMNITDASYASLIKTMDRRIQNQMSNHLVEAIRFSYLYNSQAINTHHSFNYLTFNIETAGNLLNLWAKSVKQSKDVDNHYTLFKIPFAQYIRGDMSFIHYAYLTKKTTLAYKLYVGIGIPYSNSSALPYEKSFFAGGSTSLRGWSLREVGPGSSAKGGRMQYDRAGDMIFTASCEYRFPIFGFIEGALFSDIGNIWTLNNIKGLEGGKFSKNFYKELATDVGFGLRINIQVILIRFDFAFKAYNPAEKEDKRFCLPRTKLSDMAVQFGIGYPF